MNNHRKSLFWYKEPEIFSRNRKETNVGGKERGGAVEADGARGAGRGSSGPSQL